MPVSDDGSSRPSSALGGAGGSVGPAVAEASPPETHIPLLDDFPPTGTPEHTKLGGWDLWKSMGSPKRVVAPMVDQSELAWRVLSRRHGSDLVYTPMINARAWVDAARATAAKSYKEANFNRLLGEEGSNAVKSTAAEVKVDTDRPLIVQFCANDADALLSAAKDVEAHCDAVDLNLGCPQGIARKGHYGAFLQEDWPLIFRLINNLHLRLRVAVTAKMRVYPNVERTIAYARMLERAGAQIITVHGRTRDMKGQKTGLADWNKIRAVKEAVGVPVIANGNVLFPADVEEALRVTGADAVMSAEGNLYTPTIFADAPSSPSALYPLAPRLPFPDIVVLAREYLDIVATLKTPTAVSAIRSHLFRLCRPALEVHRDMRADLGQSRPSGKDHKATGEARVDGFRAFVDALEERLSPDRTNPNYLEAPAIPRYGSTPLRPEGASALAEGTTDEARPTYVPHWLAQPYFRPENPVAEELTPEQKAANAAARAVRKAEAMAKDAKRLGRSHEGSAAASTSSVATADSAATQDRPVKTRDIQAAGEAAADGSSAIIEIVSDDMHGTRQQAEVGPSTKRAGEAEGGVLAPGEDDAPLSKKLRAALEQASTLKAQANDSFAKARYDEAVGLYNDALMALPVRPEPEPASDEESESDQVDDSVGPASQTSRRHTPAQYGSSSGSRSKGKGNAENGRFVELREDEDPEEALLMHECAKSRAVIYANLAACHLKLEDNAGAVKACNEALLDDPAYIKALHRRAQANETIGNWSSLSSALDDYKTLSQMHETPASLRATLRTKLQTLPPRIEEVGKKEKEEMMQKASPTSSCGLPPGWFGLSTDNFKITQQEGGGSSIQFVPNQGTKK